MVTAHMKSFSVALDIMEMQIKTKRAFNTDYDG